MAEIGQILPRHSASQWIDISETAYDGMKRWQWECKWCGIREYTSCMASEFKDIRWDGPDDKDYCYHCRRDGSGNVEWSLHRTGDCGYYGDGDFNWNGGWSGEKLIQPCYRNDNAGSIWGYGHYAKSTYGLPIIKLHIDVLAKWNPKKHRYGGPNRWYATLKICGEMGWRVAVVKNKPCRSLKQVKEEVDGLDLSVSIAEACRLYYDKEHVECVWIQDGQEWRPLMSNFHAWSDMEWPDPVGKYPRHYAVTYPQSRKMEDGKYKDFVEMSVHEATGGSSMSSYGPGSWDEFKYGKKPIPWIIRPGYELSEDINVNQSEL